jgi:hypothetical protein
LRRIDEGVEAYRRHPLCLAIPYLTERRRAGDLADPEYSFRTTPLLEDPNTVAGFRHVVSSDAPGLVHMPLRIQRRNHPHDILMRPTGLLPGEQERCH